MQNKDDVQIQIIDLFDTFMQFLVLKKHIMNISFTTVHYRASSGKSLFQCGHSSKPQQVTGKPVLSLSAVFEKQGSEQRQKKLTI